MGKKNYGKSVKTRLLNLMNETGYKYMVSSGKILQRETALQGFCKPVQGQFLVERRLFALCHEDGVSFDAGSIKIEPITFWYKILFYCPYGYHSL